MNDLIREAAGRTPAEPPATSAAGDLDAPKRAWGRSDGGQGRDRSGADHKPGMTALIRGHRDDVVSRARMHERLANGRVSGRPIG